MRTKVIKEENYKNYKKIDIRTRKEKKIVVYPIILKWRAHPVIKWSIRSLFSSK